MGVFTPSITKSNRFEKSFSEERMRSRVLATRPNSQVVPGSPNTPITFVRADGPHVYDADGNAYIDFDNGKGSVLVGHNDADIKVELLAAVEAGLEIITGPTPLLLEVAEHIISDIDQTFQVAFFKTGNAATRAAVTAAQRSTNRTLVVSSGWHGWDPSWAPSAPLLTPNRFGVIDFFFCLDWLETLLDDYCSDIAAIIISPDHMFLSQDYYKQLFALCARYGVLIIADEVKVGYRYRVGSSLHDFGLTADLYTFSKGLSNGTHLSCVTGKAQHMAYLADVSYTSYFEALPLVAARAVLSKLKAKNAYTVIRQSGNQFLDGLRHAIVDTGLPILIRGNGNMFKLVFANRDLSRAFYEQSLRHGVLFYTGNNQSPSLATVEVFDEALTILKRVLKDLTAQYGHMKGGSITPSEEWASAWDQMDGFPAIAFDASAQERLAFAQAMIGALP